MSQKQNSLESFWGRKLANDGTIEASQTASKKKAAFKRKYQVSYQSYRSITTGDIQAPHLLCIICREQLFNEAMKPSKLLCYILARHKDKPLQFVERK